MAVLDKNIQILMLKGEKGDTGDAGDYSTLQNKPMINNIELSGNNSASDLELVAEADLTETNNKLAGNTEDIELLQEYYSGLETDVGSLPELTTTDKTSLVNAVNEVNGKTIPITQGGTGATTATDARTNLEVEKITNLYSNGSGTNGTITLSQAFTNFTAIRVYYRVGEGERKSETFYNLGVTSPSVQLNHYNTNGTNIYMRAAPITFSNETVTWGQNAWVWRENDTWGGSNDAGQIKVYRIDGYSY